MPTIGRVARGGEMSAKDNFDENEWKTVTEGPPTAGMIVLTASGGGSFRETFALARAYADARNEHGASALLDELVAAKPQFDRHEYDSPEELHDRGLESLGAAAAILRAKAAPEDLAAYTEFVLTLAAKVAAAHKEEGQAVSP